MALHGEGHSMDEDMIYATYANNSKFLAQYHLGKEVRLGVSRPQLRNFHHTPKQMVFWSCRTAALSCFYISLTSVSVISSGVRKSELSHDMMYDRIDYSAILQSSKISYIQSQPP